MTVWHERRVLVCVGPGGVGKTSVAAALALASAAAKKPTLVLTIDPARRLANALGLDTPESGAHELDPKTLAAAGLPGAAPLTVQMPDVKRIFDAMVERFAPAEQRERLFANKIYQRFSTVLSGTLEYAAVEKLYEVYAAERHARIVLDTPPAQNAADFLDAPGRVIDFLEQESPEWLLKPYKLASKVSAKLLDVGGSFVLSTLNRFAGADTLKELAEFVVSFQGMYEGLKKRYREVKALLASDNVAFVLVTSPRREQREAALRFVVELEAAGIDVAAIVVNRVRPHLCAPGEAAALVEQAAKALATLPDADRAVAFAAVRLEIALAQEDATALEELASAAPHKPIVPLPELELDVHDLQGLVELASTLRKSM